MQFMVNKDGEEILVTDSEENRVKAKGKGYVIYESLVSPEGEQKWVSEDLAPRAIKEKGYNFSETQKNLDVSRVGRDPYSAPVSFAQGLTSTATFGFDDELAGGIKGAGALLSGNDPRPVYEQERDSYRNEKARAEEDNPLSNLAGSFVGGAILPGGAAAGSARLGTAIARGATSGAIGGGVQGLGDARNLDQPLADSAFGAAKGAVFGGGVAAGLRGVTNPRLFGKEAKEAAMETFPNYLKAAWKGFKEGSQEAPGAASVVSGPMGSVKGVLEQRRANKEVQDLVDMSRKSGDADMRAQPAFDVERPILRLPDPGKLGKPKSMSDIIDAEYVDSPRALPPPRSESLRNKPRFDSPVTDREYVGRMLMESGPNKIKDFTAEKATMAFPGELDADMYKSLLNKGISGRTQARTFNRDDAAKELLPGFEKSREVFDQARSQRWNELHGQARQGYKANDKILIDIGDALEDSASENSTRSVQGVIADIQNMVASGKGAKRRGLTEGSWDQVSDSEKFNRLQQARKQLYAQGVYAKQNGLTEAEAIIKKLTGRIDEELKISPEKVEADKMWSNSSRIEESFFDEAEFKGGLDKYKIASMLKNTDSAKRFRDNIGRFEEFINDPNLNPKLKDEGQKLLDTFKKSSSIAEQQRVLQEFRFKNGPSSGAIERQTAALGGDNSPVKEALRGPSTFMTGMDQTAKNLTNRYFGGKSFDDLSSDQKDKIVRAWFAMKKNPGISNKALDKVFK